MSEKRFEIEFLKAADESQRLIFAWACVSSIEGKPYFDKAGDHVPEAAMVEAAADFMAQSRVYKQDHRGDQRGTVLFSMPLTGEVKKAFGITCDRTGWAVAIRADQQTWDDFKAGRLRGLSMGGDYVENVPAEATS